MTEIKFRLAMYYRSICYFYDDHFRDRINRLLLGLVSLNNRTKDRGLSGQLLEMSKRYNNRPDEHDMPMQPVAVHTLQDIQPTQDTKSEDFIFAAMVLGHQGNLILNSCHSSEEAANKWAEQNMLSWGISKDLGAKIVKVRIERV